MTYHDNGYLRRIGYNLTDDAVVCSDDGIVLVMDGSGVDLGPGGVQSINAASFDEGSSGTVLWWDIAIVRPGSGEVVDYAENAIAASASVDFTCTHFNERTDWDVRITAYGVANPSAAYKASCGVSETLNLTLTDTGDECSG